MNIVYNHRIKTEDLNPSGYVVDSLKCELWCFLNNSVAEDIITEAVNLYGDPDTIGAIAGGLAGVYYGVSAIPFHNLFMSFRVY